MPGFRTSKNGKRTNYGSGSGRKINGSERAIVRRLNFMLPEAEAKSNIDTWPHWMGCKKGSGKFRLTDHGEVVRNSPYLRELKENQE